MGKELGPTTRPVLLAYQTTPHASSGETPLFLMYGHDCHLTTGLDFYVPTIQAPTLESDYAKALFAELKEARRLARQNISKSQVAQKTIYDKETCVNIKIKEGDLVMLKVQPQFKLDRPFQGPYHVYTITSICAHVRSINKPHDDLITVSLQCLSRCRGEELSAVKPWMGRGKTHKCRQLRKNSPAIESHSAVDSVYLSGAQQRTHRGRPVRRPNRYCLTIDSCP